MKFGKLAVIRQVITSLMFFLLTSCVIKFHLLPTPDYSDPCYVPPNVAVDGAATATINVWNDLNSNGKWDSGEPPLPWVTLFTEWDSNFTDANGVGYFYVFMPGCACYCGQGRKVTISTPFNYQATTPVEYELTDNNQSFFFGFHLIDSAKDISFPDEPDWFHLFTNRGISLISFHYEEGYLTVEINNSSEQDVEQLYSLFFSTIRDLEQVQISIRKVTITVNPSNEKSTCLMDDIQSSEYSMTYTEIVQSKCSHP